MNRVWCRHIHWTPVDHQQPKGKHRWWMEYTTLVPRHWKMCPICGAQRPRRPSGRLDHVVYKRIGRRIVRTRTTAPK